MYISSWRSALHVITSLSTDGTNVNILNISVDTTNPSDAFLECSFLEREYICTIDYGTDPFYTNLNSRDNSSTINQLATITLSEELERNTTYYYIVSAVSNFQCVRVQGRFRTGRYIPQVSFLVNMYISACMFSFLKCRVYCN